MNAEQALASIDECIRNLRQQHESASTRSFYVLVPRSYLEHLGALSEHRGFGLVVATEPKITTPSMVHMVRVQ
jgi:hypothetical protein